MQLQPTGEMLTLIGGLIVAYFVYVLIARKNDKPSTDPPAMAHAALREIVERAVEEARKLPELNTSTDIKVSQEGRIIADRSYEELLATAILNKVIEKFQRERVDNNSNVLCNADLPNVRCASAEEDATCRLECNNDASIKSSVDQEPVSFMMEERIEEVTTIASEDEVQGSDILESRRTRRVPFPEFGMDIVDPPREWSPSPSSLSDFSDSDGQSRVRPKTYVASCTMDLISSIESWEDNWLFQKKTTNRLQPDAVAMLVPNSNTYYKALIGDKDAEDTSDLSECSSARSDEEMEKELMEAINNVIPRSPGYSECDIENNEEPNNTMQSGKDEVDTCQRKIENNVIVGKCSDERTGKEFVQISEENIIKDKNDRKRQNTWTPIKKGEKEEDKTKEKFEDTIEGDEKITATAVESFPQKIVKMQARSEKSSERNDRENIANEDEEQRESEYTEHYDTAIQRHLDSLTKADVCSGESEVVDQTNLKEKRQARLENHSTEKLESESSQVKVQLSHATIDNHVDVMIESDQLSSPPRPGTIAEREHKKWENAPPIENNPYSEESIRKRSWDRRYSRRATDIPGSHYEITKLDEANVKALLTPDLPDIKRFGRDYYINQSKMTTGERSEQGKSSRPDSSLSQRSSYAGDEQRERQEEITFRETDCVSFPREENGDIRTTALWRRNNVEVITTNETNNRAMNPCAFADIEPQRDRNETDVGNGETWKEQRADDILEDQRKNSKNVINAKLNNQENNLGQVERQDGKDRKVRRIDLRAYGFENEFSHQKSVRKPQRVVNRLDLRFFGYQDGLHRAQSNNRLDQLPDNEKSNLTKSAIDREKHLECKRYSVDAPKSLAYKDLAKSSRDLNKLHDEFEKIGSLISAKSMPNIADDVYYYANPIRANDDDELAAKNLLNSDNSEETTMDEHDAMKTNNEISCEMDKSIENIKNEDQSRDADERLSMPSVRKLAATFSRRHISKIEPVSSKMNKISTTKIDVDDIKNISSTPEIQIVESPRQMHSLTARSLSKEFREGLRQMPSKVTSPPVTRSLIEEQPAKRMEIVRSKREDHDIAVISPGKLKSNIMFWEQMQKKD